MNNGLASSGLIIQSFAVDLLHPSVVIAGTDEGLYKSADGGATWALKSNADILFLLLLTPITPDFSTPRARYFSGPLTTEKHGAW